MATDGSQQLQEKPISPGTEEKMNILRQALRTEKVRLEKDSEGKVQIVYEGEKSIPLSHVDPSKAYTVQEGKTPSDVRTRVDVCLETIEAIKQNRAPSGVAIDSSKAKPSRLGQYAEGEQFTRLGKVLGNGNFAGDIVVVKDNKTDAEQAMKTVLISTFLTDEVRAWVDLGESESFPSLYLFRLEGNKVVFHMEKLENGEIAVEFSPRVFLHRQRKSTLMKDHLQETTLVKDHPQKTTLMKHHPQKTTLKKDHHAKTTLIKGHPQKTTLLKDYPQKTPI